MAFQLPNLSYSLLLLQSIKSPKEKLITHQPNQSFPKPYSLPSLISSSSSSLTKLEIPPILLGGQDKELSSAQASVDNKNNSNSNSSNQNKNQNKNDFYVNLGLAVRTLREDMPLLFTKDLNYDIYRDDITFIDPLNTFTGIEKYKLIFWALRFHGRVLFRDISFEILRVWQPSENVILIRWNLRGVPRVPWEANGQFQGTSRYKLDRNGKIYEHKVDNLAFNFPRPLRPPTSMMDLVAPCPASPNPTFLWGPTNEYSSSWLELYRAVRGTLDSEGYLLQQKGLVTCS